MRKLSIEELNRVSTDDFKKQNKKELIVVLDNIRSLSNVGSAFRTSDAFAVKEIVLGGITGTPPNKEINKTALGAQDTVTWRHEADLESYLKSLEKSHDILAVEQTTDSTSLASYLPGEKPIVIVFGNEVKGVSDSVLSCCTGSIEIPQFGTKHSLNVAVTIGIVCYTLTQKI